MMELNEQNASQG